MNKKCCQLCVKQFLELCINNEFGKKVRMQRHKKTFDEWFDKLWQKCNNKAPCRWLVVVDGEKINQIVGEHYPASQKIYYYVERTIPPENCPYIAEHVVSE